VPFKQGGVEAEADSSDRWPVRLRARGRRQLLQAGPTCHRDKREEGAAACDISSLGQRRRARGNWAFGPKLRRRIFPFSFLILQIHFQIILEIIFFLK
jgi:hypothetical protein